MTRSERMKQLWKDPAFRERMKNRSPMRRKPGELKAEREERKRRRELKRAELEAKRAERRAKKELRDRIMKMDLRIQVKYCPVCLEQIIRGECWCEKRKEGGECLTE